MIKPTVGRKVWFCPSQEIIEDYNLTLLADVDDSTKMQPLDATIIGVHSDVEVNLFIIDANGDCISQDRVSLLQDADLPPEDTSYAMWMPYQVSAAAKDNTAVQPATGTVA